MARTIRRWNLELLEGEGRCVLSLYYSPPIGGSVVWDTIALPHLADNPTEADVLDEFYGGLLRFMEQRGHLR